MPLSTEVVGRESAPVYLFLDPRWTMNYAAAVGDNNPRLYDTRGDHLPVHPLILASPEWEATKLLHDDLGLTSEESGRAVEVSHDTRIYRPLMAGESLDTVVRVVGLSEHKAGAWLTLQADTNTLAGELVVTTVTGVIYRGVRTNGTAGVPRPSSTTTGVVGDRASALLDLPLSACHVYSECSRIYNALHTDLAVADKAGLPGLILHGSATLAMGLSEINNSVLDGDIASVARIYGEFRAMVVVPSTPNIEYAAPVEGATSTAFEIRTPEGGLALANGLVEHAATT
jgi:acyl dehydratase